MTTMTTLHGKNYGYRALVIYSRWLVCALVGVSLIYPRFVFADLPAFVEKISRNAVENGGLAKDGFECGDHDEPHFEYDVIYSEEYCYSDIIEYPSGPEESIASGVRYCSSREAEYLFPHFSHMQKNGKYPADWTCVFTSEPPTPRCTLDAGIVQSFTFQQSSDFSEPQGFCSNNCEWSKATTDDGAKFNSSVCLANGVCYGEYKVDSGGEGGKGIYCDRPTDSELPPPMYDIPEEDPFDPDLPNNDNPWIDEEDGCYVDYSGARHCEESQDQENCPSYFEVNGIRYCQAGGGNGGGEIGRAHV